MNEINKRIKLKRRARGLTQSVISKKLNMKESTYSQMERTGKISCETLIKIAKILDVDFRYFLYGDKFLEENENKTETPPPKPVEPEKPEPKEEEPNIFCLDTKERYIITTYRNLNPKNQQEAYSLFMKHFNINTIIHERRKERKLQRASKSKNDDII